MACAAAGLAWALSRSTSGPASASVAVPAAQAATPAVPQDFGVLLGEWTRPDGGYVLSVSQVAPDGKAAVGYYNPRPIRVSRAEARREGGKFVELIVAPNSSPISLECNGIMVHVSSGFDPALLWDVLSLLKKG